MDAGARHTLRRNALLYYGRAGEKWADALDDLIADAALALDLELSAPFPDVSINYVAPARQHGRDVVLKLCCDPDEFALELAALQAFPASECVRALAADPARRALVLERVTTGSPLDTLPEEDAIEVAIRLAARLHVPPPADHSFPTVATWCGGLARHRERVGGAGPLPRDLFERAEELSRELLASAPSPALLHGDLHHHNILFDEARGWIAIDPKGVVGDPCYELCALLRNPPGFARRPDALELLSSRVDIAVEHAGVPRERLLAWGLVEAVLSASWDVDEESEGVDVPMARMYLTLLSAAA